jgi:hypothetical protein
MCCKVLWAIRLDSNGGQRVARYAVPCQRKSTESESKI